MGMLARLGCLTAAQYVEAVDIAVRSVIMYYGAATPMSRSACERIDRAKRIGLAAMGHRARRSARWLVHAKEAEGGMGMGLTWAQAGAALVAEVSRVLRRPGTPAYMALTSQIAATYWRLGWRPTAAAPRPLDWWPVHLQGTRALREDYVVESFLAFCLEAGMRTEARGGADAADAMGSGWWGEPSESDADASVWEVEGRAFSWRLAQLGLVTRRDLYGGRSAGGEGRWRTNAEVAQVYGRAGPGGRGRLTATEEAELRQLRCALTEEEHEWARSTVAAATARPPKPLGRAVKAWRVGRNGHVQYWVERKEREAGWEERPANLTQTARKQMRAMREAEGGAEAETAREAMRRERGDAWLWLATEAPMIADDARRGEMVREAEEKGVQLGEADVGAATEAATAACRGRRGAAEEAGEYTEEWELEGEEPRQEETSSSARESSGGSASDVHASGASDAHASGPAAHDPAHGATSSSRGQYAKVRGKRKSGMKRQREAAAAAISAAVGAQIAQRAQQPPDPAHTDDSDML